MVCKIPGNIERKPERFAMIPDVAERRNRVLTQLLTMVRVFGLSILVSIKAMRLYIVALASCIAGTRNQAGICHSLDLSKRPSILFPTNTSGLQTWALFFAFVHRAL